MKKSSFAYLLLALPFAAGAANMTAPIAVSGTRFSQDRQTQRVTVKYALANQGEPAWVTMDVLTNGVSIGMQYVKTVRGDISQRGADFMAGAPVADDGQEKTIVWDARKDWPGNIGSNASVVVSAWYTNFVPEVYMVVDLSEGPEAARYPEGARFLVECGRGALPGGNGAAWDWSAARALSPQPFALAGGLGPANLAAAASASGAVFFDLSSSVEFAPGRKDRDKVLAAVAAARAVGGTPGFFG